MLPPAIELVMDDNQSSSKTKLLGHAKYPWNYQFSPKRDLFFICAGCLEHAIMTITARLKKKLRLHMQNNFLRAIDHMDPHSFSAQKL
jgi:hypothetical protein